MYDSYNKKFNLKFQKGQFDWIYSDNPAHPKHDVLLYTKFSPGIFDEFMYIQT